MPSEGRLQRVHRGSGDGRNFELVSGVEHRGLSSLTRIVLPVPMKVSEILRLLECWSPLSVWTAASLKMPMSGT